MWAVLTVAAAVLSLNTRIESDIKQLDGSEPEVINAEKTFMRPGEGRVDRRSLWLQAVLLRRR